MLLDPALSALCGACATTAPDAGAAGEDVRIPASEPGITLLLRHKRPSSAAAPRGDRSVLLVHGLTYPGSIAFDLPLGGRFDAWAVDVRGYGGSTRPAAMDEPPERNPPVVDATAGTADVAAAIEHIRRVRGVERVSIVAWSWGTVLAALYAGAHPEAIGRLVLYAPVWRWPGGAVPRAPAGAYRTVTREAARRGWMTGVPAAAQESLIPPGWFEQWADANWAADPLGQGALPPTLRAPNGPLVEVIQAWSEGRTLFDAAAIRAPTLVVVGAWDATTPPPMARDLQATLARTTRARLVEVAEATHQLFLERRREQLFEAVRTFLDERP
jgi:pimeloyl-ACP methyl ester carboxylesterase